MHAIFRFSFLQLTHPASSRWYMSKQWNHSDENQRAKESRSVENRGPESGQALLEINSSQLECLMSTLLRNTLLDNFRIPPFFLREVSIVTNIHF